MQAIQLAYDLSSKKVQKEGLTGHLSLLIDALSHSHVLLYDDVADVCLDHSGKIYSRLTGQR